MRRVSSSPARRWWFLAPAFVVAITVATGPVSAQTESVLQNLRFGSETVSYEIPRLIVRGSRLSQADLSRLADPASPEPWAERVAKLEAEEILAPEMQVNVKMPEFDQRSVYRDVTFRRVGGGKVASVTAAGGTVEGTQAGKKISGSYGAMALQEVDVGAALALVDAKGGPNTPLKRIYGAFTIDGMKTTDGEGMEVRVGKINGGEFSAKPTTRGWMESVKLLGAAQGKKDPETTRATLEILAEMLDSYAMGPLEIADMSMSGHSKKDDIDVNMGMKKAVYTPSAAGRAGALRVEGSHLQAGDIRLAYDAMTFSGLDGKAAVEFFRALALNPEKPDPAVFRRLMPMFSSLQFDNVEMEGPIEGGKGLQSGGAKMKVTLGRFEMAAEKPINGVPTDIRFGMRNFGMPVPPNSDNAGAAMLGQLGYDRIDGSLGLNIGWNEAGQEIVIREISLDGKDMGSATIRGVIGRIGRDVFNADSTVAMVSLMAAAAKSLDLTIDNRGLFERLLAREAARQKRPADDIRREYGVAAAVAIPAILGPGPNAKALALAVGKFVAKPGKLTLQARAKKPEGYGIADYMANSSPAGILEAIDLTATAE